MRRLHYHRVDVFTDRAFGGNPLAVFTNGRGLSTETMQAIAKEFNLSETTFVLPPDDAKHDCRVRIFTPGGELPMAGHPTIGTAFVLCRDGFKNRPQLIFEEGVGPIPVTIEWTRDMPNYAEMRQPLPLFGATLQDLDQIAEMLSVSVDAIGSTSLPVQVVSCGVPYLFVPLVDLRTIRRARLRADVWEKVVGDLEPKPDTFVFTTEVEFNGSNVHGRMFAPGHGITEDPATGSASGPLGCYLVRHQVIASDSELRCVSEQGIEMGRPSFMKIRV